MKATDILLLVILLMLPVGHSLAGFAGGDGSAANPWQVATPAQLDEIRNDLEAHYILTADIDLTEATGDPSGAFWNNGNGWKPIGSTLGSSFIGSLDGNGFKISGLFIDRVAEDQTGLFGWISFGAELTGLALESVNMTGDSLVGALVVTNFGGTVSNSYVTGVISGVEFVGGLVARNLSGTVTNSYVAANVSGSNNVGALAGSNWAIIENSYATGSVNGLGNVGGLVGVSSRAVRRSYWNTETSGQQSSAGGGAGLTSAEMRKQASFEGFDFDATWHIRESAAFPVLIHNPQDPAPGSSTSDLPDGIGDNGSSIIRSEVVGAELSGTMIISGTGILNGGSITGTIRNIGRIKGEVTLGADSVIRGGTVSGDIRGDASRPALIRGSRVTAEASLRNVLIGHGTVLDSDVRIGPGVSFASASSIPPGIDLTGALRAMSWKTGDGRAVPDLSADVPVASAAGAPFSIISGIRLPDEFEPATKTQDNTTGELSISSSEVRAVLLPHRVRQALPGQPDGVFTNEDGDIVLVTANGREVLTYPVLADSVAFASELEGLGLQMQYGERASIWLSSIEDGTSGSAEYLSMRAGLIAMPAGADQQAGLFFQAAEGLSGATAAYLVFSDENGVLMRQDLSPAPVDWPALKNTLATTAGINDVRMDTQGIISVSVNGLSVRARTEYEAIRETTGTVRADNGVVLFPAGDVNGDGTEDFRVLYPDGYAQMLLIFPLNGTQ